MKKIILIAVAVLFIFVSCTEKKKVETKKVEPSKTEKTEKIVKEKKNPPLSAETFSKGGSVHNITMKSISSGKNIDFSQYKGKKILFDFWSSWCEPCIEMFPIINKIKKDVEDGKGTLKILSISVDPMPGKVKEIMKKKKVKFEVLNAPPDLANAGILMPYMAVADENGKIIATTSGKHTYEEIIKLIGGEKTPEK